MLSLILLIAFPFLIWAAWKSVRLSRESAVWPSVPGTVTAAERKKRGFRMQPCITYSYQVEGRDYAGTKITFAAAVPSKDVEPILSQYPLGSEVKVYYSPRHPSVAVLEPGPNRYVSAILRSYMVWCVLILFLNVLNFGLNRWILSQKETEAPVRTYDDVTAADPGFGDRLIRDGADKGDAKDEGYVGTWYFGGLEGYPKDPGEAAKWFRKSAEQGDASSQSMLGSMFARGIGVPKDLAEAVAWFQKSAAQGDPHGCVGLGMAYERGVANIPQDKQKAIDWYRKAGDDKTAKECLARLGVQ